MNVLFFVYNYSKDQSNSGLQKDLIKKFAEKKNKVYVISMADKLEEKYKIERDGDIVILYVKTGKMYENKNKVKKAMTILSTPYYFKKYFLKCFSNIKIDLLIGYAPYNVNLNIQKFLKKKYGTKSFLQIWDFFPDNALNLGVIKNKIVYKYFKMREKKIYKSYDILISNSEGGLNYLDTHYNFLKNKPKLLVRNCEYLKIEKLEENEVEKIRREFKYSKDDKILIFGGNIGIAQELENLVDIIDKGKIKNIEILIIGYGTEKEKLIELINKKNIKNIRVVSGLAREKYEKLVLCSNGGIISLSHKFKVPNAPTKLTTYLKAGKPIFALLDSYTKNDLGKLIDENDIGVWAESGNIEEGIMKLKKFIKKLENNSREKYVEFYKKEFNVELAYNEIIKQMGDEEIV